METTTSPLTCLTAVLVHGWRWGTSTAVGHVSWTTCRTTEKAKQGDLGTALPKAASGLIIMTVLKDPNHQ